MRIVVAVHGTRGDVEPCAAVARELAQRGHDVRMAVPPNLVDFVESAGLPAVAYGPDSQHQLEGQFVRNFWSFQNPITLLRTGIEHLADGWAEMSRTLVELAGGADLILTGALYQAVAANVAEYHGIPMSALHCFPLRTNGRLIPFLPPPVVRVVISTIWWLHWRMTKRSEDAQRRELGLPLTGASSVRRILDRDPLELQAYDRISFPGLVEEWAGWVEERPFVGALTMALATNSDDDVTSWIAAGKPPIAFCFGSIPIRTPDETLAMITAACEQLGERALICTGASELIDLPETDRIKIVGLLNYAAVFPSCRAVVHHGGAGTTAIGMRAGIPTLILWTGTDQPIWAAMIRRLKVGSSRRISNTTGESLAADLGKILTVQYVSRARKVATLMTQPADAIALAADRLEEAASGPPAGHRTAARSAD